MDVVLPLPPSRCQITLSYSPSKDRGPSSPLSRRQCGHPRSVYRSRSDTALAWSRISSFPAQTRSANPIPSINDWHVLSQAQRVVAVDPVMIKMVRGHLRSLELRSGNGVERPTFRALLPRSGWPVERALALAAVEAGEIVAARSAQPKRCHWYRRRSPRCQSLHARFFRIIEWRLVNFRLARCRRIVAGYHPHDSPGTG